MATGPRTRGDNRLTDTGLRRARLNNGKAILQDGGGLILAVLESGGRRVARAVYRFRLGDKRIDMRLGSWPDKSLADLRALRNEARLLVQAGVDPRAAAREKQAAAKRAPAPEQAAVHLTVRVLYERWDRLHLRRVFKDGGDEVRRHFERDILPAVGGVLIEDLSRRHVAAIVDGCLEREAPRVAQIVLSLVRQLIRWGMSRGYLESDPSAGISKSAIRTNGPRERVLSDDELRDLVRLLPVARLPQWAPPAVWLLLASAARVGELQAARWEDIDRERRTWLIPAEHTKNGRPHLVDLSDFALARLDELAALREGPWLVAGRTPASPAHDKALTQLLTHRQRSGDAAPAHHHRIAQYARALILPGGPWTSHDLRRTAATLMQALGVAPAVIEKALNHTEPRRLVAVYQRHDYRTERRDAFARLGGHLAQLRP